MVLNSEEMLEGCTWCRRKERRVTRNSSQDDDVNADLDQHLLWAPACSSGLHSRRTVVGTGGESVQCHCRGPALNLDSNIIAREGGGPKPRYSRGDIHTYAVVSYSSVSDAGSECSSVLARYGT